MKADILIKNGLIIDPFNNRNEKGDVAVLGGKIINAADVDSAAQVVDAQGCIVCPGLIDYHAHVGSAIAEMATNPMTIAFPNGVTTIVDPGSSGTSNYLALRAFTETLPVRIMVMLHLSPEGNLTASHPENQDPSVFNAEKIKRYVDTYKDQIVGIKLRLDNRILGGLGTAPLIEAVKIRDMIGCPLICHITNPPIPMNELIEYFKPGDVFTHVFHGVGNTLLDENGKVFASIKEAQAKGVYMDASNGRRNFSTKVAKAAMEDGFYPDILSTDITAATAYADNQNVVSLPFIMSKYLAFGMKLDEVIRCVTQNPARAIGMEEEIGSLSEGSCADIAILRKIEKQQRFSDQDGEYIEGQYLLKPEMTIREGVCVYRQIDFY